MQLHNKNKFSTRLKKAFIEFHESYLIKGVLLKYIYISFSTKIYIYLFQQK